jgi:membrane protease YdiL (CAAX protease family)
MAVVFMLILQCVFAYGIYSLAVKAQMLELEKTGKLVTNSYFIANIKLQEIHSERVVAEAEKRIATLRQNELIARAKGARIEQVRDIASSVKYLEAELAALRKNERDALQKVAGRDTYYSMLYSKSHGLTTAAAQKQLSEQAVKFGSAGFIPESEVTSSLCMITTASPLACLVVALMLAWWFVMIGCQGEGVELDFQRRRHPMWEWLLGHPVSPGAVFFAEMLGPLAVNPMYMSAPFFWGLLFWHLHDFGTGVAALFLIGVPVAMALACVSKALEIGAMLRLSMRSRGAVLGLMSWLGYVSMVGAFFIPKMNRVGIAALRLLEPLAALGPWSWVHCALGFNAAGGTSLGSALMVFWPLALVLCVGAVAYSKWATEKGLAGGFGNAPVPSGVLLEAGVSSLGGDPLFRKELLWFWRDRGAVVQAILIPVTMAAFQLVNFRFALEHALEAWHWMSGAAVLFGTYFLFILGPRSLVSEGPALWLAWTWPRGMEELLKAKARMWWMLASMLVGVVLLAACVMFPADAWKVALVGVGWFAFSHSLAQKSVTLVSKPSDSGEGEPIPAGRRWAATLGTFTFAIGVLTQQWSLAVVGVVYSWLTAAAMWQNFRARLPFLYDPWSEKLPPPPTLMHAMVAISAMLEVLAIFTGILVAWLGADSMQTARAIGYAVTALITFLIMGNWLKARGVSMGEVWTWRVQNDANTRPFPLSSWLAVAGLGGALLAGMAMVYTSALMMFPDFAEQLMKTSKDLAEHPSQHWWLAVTAVLCAPLAEEYLFRGLLYRALDREWGGWQAVLASAGFFAIYHPPTSWLPVACVGAANAVLFRHSQSLWPAVVLHTTYNALVVLWV